MFIKIKHKRRKLCPILFKRHQNISYGHALKEYYSFYHVLVEILRNNVLMLPHISVRLSYKKMVALKSDFDKKKEAHIYSQIVITNNTQQKKLIKFDIKT